MRSDRKYGGEPRHEVHVSQHFERERYLTFCAENSLKFYSFLYLTWWNKTQELVKCLKCCVFHRVCILDQI